MAMKNKYAKRARISEGIDAPICQDTHSGSVCDVSTSAEVCHDALVDLAREETFEAPDDLTVGAAVGRTSHNVVDRWLVVRGRRRELGLGSVALVSLAEAREQARTNRRLARAGGDPLADKHRTQDMPTFAAAAIRVVEQKQGGWRHATHATTWRRSLERYAFPRIGRRPVAEVTSADVLEILTPIWHVKPQTARRIQQRIHAVMEWAIAMRYRSGNPCDRLGPVLGPQQGNPSGSRRTPIWSGGSSSSTACCRADG